LSASSLLVCFRARTYRASKAQSRPLYRLILQKTILLLLVFARSVAQLISVSLSIFHFSRSHPPLDVRPFLQYHNPLSLSYVHTHTHTHTHTRARPFSFIPSNTPTSTHIDTISLTFLHTNILLNTHIDSASLSRSV
jgi:hypothetical protein